MAKNMESPQPLRKKNYLDAVQSSNPQELDKKIQQLEGQIDSTINRKDQDKMNQLIDKIEKK